MATQKIETGLIADSAVTTAKLADNSVTAAKIAAGSLDDQVKGISSSADAVAITIDSSEKVGIGTDSPSQKLHVATSSGDSIILVDNGTSQARFATDNDGPYIYALTSGDSALRVFGESSERMRIDSSGNLLVGTTTFNNLSTESGILASNNVVMARGGLTDHQDACGVLQYLSDATWLRAYGDTAGSGYMIFRTGGGGGSSDSEAMRIDSSGRVGIAQDAPGDFNASADDLVIGNSGGDFGITIRTGTASNGSIHFADGTTGDGPNRGIITYDHSDDRMQFNVAAAEKMRIKSDGQITTQGDILPGADVIMANGRGISFAATANSSGSMSNELLDDYEEGTWTPTLIGASSNPSVTYIYQYGTYTKIGNVVHCNAAIRTSDYTGGSGDLRISGLPFTSGGSTAENIGSCMFYKVASFYETVVYVQPNNTYCFFLGRDTLTTSGGWAGIQTTDWTAANPTLAIFSVTYFV